MGNARVEYYLRKADECERRAEGALNPEHREVYRELVRQWQTLARDAEAQVSQNIPPY
jgi:hypothetical protein